MSYYDNQSEAFIAGTQNVDMSALYQRFLPKLTAGAAILDAGCGSGRDSIHFANCGYRVCAFDASAAMVQHVKATSNIHVSQATFTSYQTTQKFDGIWACASLLHVPFSELGHTMRSLSQHLLPNGLFYCSFKYGDDETSRDGRSFTNMNEARLLQVLPDGLSVTEQWLSGDARPGREHEKWLNTILVMG